MTYREFDLVQQIFERQFIVRIGDCAEDRAVKTAALQVYFDRSLEIPVKGGLNPFKRDFSLLIECAAFGEIKPVNNREE